MLLRDVPPKTQTVINIFIIRRVNEEGEIIINTLSLGNKLWHGETTFPQSHTSEISMELPNRVSGLLFFLFASFCVCVCVIICVWYVQCYILALKFWTLNQPKVGQCI